LHKVHHNYQKSFRISAESVGSVLSRVCKCPEMDFKLLLIVAALGTLSSGKTLTFFRNLNVDKNYWSLWGMPKPVKNIQ